MKPLATAWLVLLACGPSVLPSDAGSADGSGWVDAGLGDAGTGDAGTGDAGTGDAGTGDAGTGDAGTGDAGTGDAGTGDAGTGDAGTGDAGAGDAGPWPRDGGSVQWFGFTAVDCGFIDPHSPLDGGDYGPEVAGFTNFIHLCTFREDDVITSRVERALSRRQRSLVHIEASLFHEVPGTAPSGASTQLRLRADARTAWATFVQRNAAVLDPAHIVAFLMADEPTWRGLPSAELATALDLVKATHPNIPTLVIEAYPVVAQWTIPPALDWVGFERYFTFDPSTDVDWQRDFHTLQSRRSRVGQKIWLAMDTQWRPAYGTAGVTPAMMDQVARNYLKVAASDRDVVGIVGYLWPGGLDEAGQLGARDLPASVRDAYRVIGKAVTGY